MKKISILLMFLVLCVCGLMAQAPEKFTYQAVVRNAGNSLVTNAQVGVRVSVLQGIAQGTPVFVETHSASTNANGLVTLEIGGGNAQTGSFSAINWADGVFFLKTEIDPNGGNNYSVTTTQQLLSVPYALYAKQAENGFSGDYNDLTNTPAIPTLPTNVSAFTNDAGYITMDSIPAIPTVPTNVSAFTNDAGYLTGYTETDPQFNAWDKNYNDLTNKPEIPTVPTNVSAFTNDAGYITMDSIPAIPTVPTNVSAFTNDVGYLTGYTETDPQFNAWDKNYNDLTNKPVIPTVPTNVSAFTNDAGYITMDSIPAIPTVPTNVSAFTNDAGYLTGYTETDPQFNAWDKNYNDLTNKPEIPTVPTNVSAFTNDAGYLTGYTETDPQFNAWDKNYNDLTNKPEIPTVPTNVSAFTNDAGYITMDSIPAIPTVPTNVSAFTNDAGYLTGYTETDPQFNAWDKNYNDLTNKPEIPTVPTNVSAFTNDAGYLTGYTETDPQFNAWDKNYNDLTNKPEIPTVPTNVSAFTNDAGYITMDSIPAIPTVPTNVSAFTNDAGYLTEYIETDPLFSTWDKNYNDLTNKPEIPTVPTNVSAFTNDAGYITMDSIRAIPTVPTNVSAFTNDAGYLTGYTETDPLFSTWDKSYNDLTDTPEIPAAANDATLTIQKNGSTVGTFSADATDNQTVNITVPTQTSQLENNSGYITMAELQQILAEMNHRIDSLENVINGTTPEVPEDTVDGGPCPGHHTVTDVEGNTYNTVWIGGQCWMKENLRTRKYPDGTDITFVNSGLSVAEGRCYYPNGDAANVTSYGYLYNWAAAMHGSGSSSSNPSNVQGACPEGWHLPSNAEWTQLLNYVRSKSEFQCNGNNNNIAKALSSGTGWQTSTTACAVGNDLSLNNQTGFSAMPAGTYNANYYIGSSTEFWSSTEKDGAIAYTVYLSSNSASPISFIPEKKYAYSVRCLLGTAGSVVVAPSVTTLTTSEVTKTSVKCGGVVTQDGGSPVTARGVCWSTGYNPALIEGQYTVDGTGTGSFVSQITGLNAGATYRAWAYATNSEGTTFGEAISFTTTFGTDGQPCSGAATVTDVDGNVYNTIMLGNFCWMKENLRTTKFPDGTPIALGTDSSSTMAYRYYPNNDSSNVATYGYLYNWSAFIHNQEGQSGNVQGICPAGWHIPKNEMSQLDGYVSGQSDYVCGGDESNNAKALASTEGWKTSSNLCAPGNNPASNNVTGFSLPPAGYYRVNYSSETFGQSAVVWHANSNGTIYLWPYRINYSSSDFSGAGGLNEKLMKSLGHSVRCARN